MPTEICVSAEKAAIIAAANNRQSVHHIATGDLKGPSKEPLSPTKNEEKPSTVWSQSDKEAQLSCDSCPQAKISGSRCSIDTWQTRFEELKVYKRKHGDCNVPQKDNDLGVWVNKQRNEYNKRLEGMKSQLSLEQMSQLNSIGFSWTVMYGQDLWVRKYNEMYGGQDLWVRRYNELKEYKRMVSRDRTHEWSNDRGLAHSLVLLLLSE